MTLHDENIQVDYQVSSKQGKHAKENVKQGKHAKENVKATSGENTSK